MLYILFQVGEHTYAIDGDSVVTVLPGLPLRELPGTPSEVIGLLDYRNVVVPVIDICEIMLKRPTGPCLSSRYLLLDYLPERKPHGFLGLYAEQVTNTVTIEAEAIIDAGVKSPEAQFLGPMFKMPDGKMVQTVKVQELIPKSLQDILYKN